jgi:hypothetical protein
MLSRSSPKTLTATPPENPMDLLTSAWKRPLLLLGLLAMVGRTI